LRRCVISDLLDLIITPVPGQNPMGENINYDMDFDALKIEINKLGNIDYALIEDKSKILLRNRSKDIRLLGFLSLCYIRNSQWDMLADVFEGFSKLADQNYDSLFPDRPIAKLQALQWLSQQRYIDALTNKKPDEKELEHIVRLSASLAKLKNIIDKKFPQDSPFPVGLYGAVSNWEKQCKSKPIAEPPTVIVEATPSQPEVMESPKEAQISGKKAAYFLIEKEPQNIMGYRLMRSLRWDMLEKAPPTEGGKTKLAPPPAELMASLSNALKANDYKTALTKAEIAFTAGANNFWLDLQRIAAFACKNLGSQYTNVYQAILYETGLLIKRIPELISLCFSDGTPMCDDATKDWINSEVKMLFIGNDASGQAALPASADTIETEKKEAIALAAGGNSEKAIDIVQTAIRHSSNERDNFRRSIIMCSILVTVKQFDIALSILESLNEKIASCNIDKWDPDLAVEAWSSMVKVLKFAKNGKAANIQTSLQEKMNSILYKISQIDLKTALSLNT
jgi:type VI secretion system protein VasJ